MRHAGQTTLFSFVYGDIPVLPDRPKSYVAATLLRCGDIPTRLYSTPVLLQPFMIGAIWAVTPGAGGGASGVGRGACAAC